MKRARRSTVAALTVAFIVLTGTAILATDRLRRQATLSDEIRVDWASWMLVLLLAYAGFALIGWWALARDRRRSQ